MNSGNVVTLIAAGLAFLASVFAVVVSAYNARFKRYASERWWERKVDAYISIVDALSDMVYYYDQIYYAEIEGRQINPKRQDEINEVFSKAIFRIKKASTIGAFMISKEADESLRQYWVMHKQENDPNDWYTRLELDYITAEKCLNEIVKYSKIDLNL